MARVDSGFIQFPSVVALAIAILSWGRFLSSYLSGRKVESELLVKLCVDVTKR